MRLLLLLSLLSVALHTSGQKFAMLNVAATDATPRWIGKKLPDSLLVDLSGGQFRLSEYVGKVVVVNCWFSGCFPCIEEIPELNKLKDDYGENKIAYIAVTFDEPDRIAVFLDKNPFLFRIAHSAKKILESKQIWAVDRYPTTFVLNQAGVVTYQASGFFAGKSMRKLREAIDKSLPK